MNTTRKELAGIMILAGFVLTIFAGTAVSFTVPSGHPAMEAAAPGKQVVRMFAANNNTWLYMCYLPPEYENQPARKWPVIMFITGGGGSSLAPWSNFMGDGPVNYLQTPSTCKYLSDSFIVITPWVDENFLKPCNSNDPNYTAYFPPLFSHLFATFRIDAARVHLDGYCFGGAVWYKYAVLYPNVPASLSIWSVGNTGSCVDPARACQVKNIPIQWWQNDGDSFAPYQAGKAVCDAIKACGSTTVNFYLCNGGWHEIWRYGSMYNSAAISDKTPAVYSWMLPLRNPSPTAVVNPDNHSIKMSDAGNNCFNVNTQSKNRVELFSLDGRASAGHSANRGVRVVRMTMNDRSVVSKLAVK